MNCEQERVIAREFSLQNIEDKTKAQQLESTKTKSQNTLEPDTHLHTLKTLKPSFANAWRFLFLLADILQRRAGQWSSGVTAKGGDTAKHKQPNKSGFSADHHATSVDCVVWSPKFSPVGTLNQPSPLHGRLSPELHGEMQ